MHGARRTAQIVSQCIGQLTMDGTLVVTVVALVLLAFYVGWKSQRDKMETFVSEKAKEIYSKSKAAFDSGKKTFGEFKKAAGEDTDAVMYRNLYAAHRGGSLTPTLVQSNLL